MNEKYLLLISDSSKIDKLNEPLELFKIQIKTERMFYEFDWDLVKKSEAEFL